MMKTVSATCRKDGRVGTWCVYLNQNAADSGKPVIALTPENLDFSAFDVAFEDVNGICFGEPQ